MLKRKRSYHEWHAIYLDFSTQSPLIRTLLSLLPYRQTLCEVVDRNFLEIGHVKHSYLQGTWLHRSATSRMGFEPAYLSLFTQI